MIVAQIPGSGLLTGAESGLIQGVVSMATVKPDDASVTRCH